MTFQNIPKNGKPIVLVGLMGAGKTAIGKRLAAKMRWKFRDSDQEIEQETGMTVSDIFAKHGEAWFREQERKTIARLLKQKETVIATGGGAFIQEQTRTLILHESICIWLRADLDILVERVSRKNTRPLLEKGDKYQLMKNLLDQRAPIYAKAHAVVDSTSEPHETVLNEIQYVLAQCA